MGDIIQFPRKAEVSITAMAEAIAEILAQASTEVSRLIYAHEQSARYGTLPGPRGLYECVRIATEAGLLDVQAILSRMDAATKQHAGGIA